jgi:rhodanese-related sulfurtransferase
MLPLYIIPAKNICKLFGWRNIKIVIFFVLEVLSVTYKKISPKELHERILGEEKAVLLDVRAEEKYKDFHIESSQVVSFNIPKTEIFNLEEGGVLSQLPKERPVVVTCTTGNSAAKCAKILDELGFKVEVLEGGLTAWKEYRK